MSPVFITGRQTVTPQPMHVELSQDGREVNILVNGILVAFFDATDGTLQATWLSESERRQLEASGMAMDPEHQAIRVVRLRERV